jgi:hypothetical protein
MPLLLITAGTGSHLRGDDLGVLCRAQQSRVCSTGLRLPRHHAKQRACHLILPYDQLGPCLAPSGGGYVMCRLTS